MADPPYPGKAHLYPENEEVDLDALVLRLLAYDGWVLATDPDGLPLVLRACDARDVHPQIASWHRGGRVVRSSRPTRTWEPVLYMPVRAMVLDAPPLDTLRFHSNPRITDPGRVVGAKPAAWWSWVFDLLQARRGDSFDDFYPASGAGNLAWQVYTGETDVS